MAAHSHPTGDPARVSPPDSDAVMGSCTRAGPPSDPASSADTPETDPSETPLRAILEIQLDDGVDCPVVRETPNASAVTQTLTRGTDTETCQNGVTVVENGSPQTTYVSTQASSSCVCSTISGFECAFDVESVRDGALIVSVIVSARELLTEIVSAVRETGARVTLRRLTRLQDGDGDGGQIELDATAITDKQRDAVELAIERGYYDQPRGVDLEWLADELGVSKSAVSQRLTAVESTLVRSLVSGPGR